MLKKITAATTQPVSLARVKDRLHIDTSDFDADLTDLIAVATASTEHEANIVLQTSTWELLLSNRPRDFEPAPLGYTLDRGFFAAFSRISIPAFPVRDVTAVKYLDENTDEQTIDPANYTFERTDSGADIVFNQDYVLPAIAAVPQALRITFDAGYDNPSESGGGDDPELVLPPQAEMAVMFLVAHWHANRASVVVDFRSAPFEIPDTFDYLVQQIKIYR